MVIPIPELAELLELAWRNAQSGYSDLLCPGAGQTLPAARGW
jgi:hypothetical protein